MGLFGKLFGDGDANAAQPAANAHGAWRARLSMLLALSDDAKTQAYCELARAIGDQLGQGQVVPIPNDVRAEWRGQVYGLPTRVVIEGTSASGGIRWRNPHGNVDLDHQPEYVNQPSPEAWSEDDVQRLFVGKGVYIETFAWGMPDELLGFRSLPWEPMYYVVQGMIRDRARHVYIRSDEIEFDFLDDLQEMQDPVSQVARFSQIVAWAAAKWAATPPDPSIQAARDAAEGGKGVDFPGAPITITCSFCRTLYLLGADAACPNCGAPARR